jgi:hypothetical protein
MLDRDAGDIGVVGDHLLIEPLGLDTQAIGVALAKEELIGVVFVGLLDLLIVRLAVVADHADEPLLGAPRELASGRGGLGLLLEVLGQGQPRETLGFAALGGSHEAQQERVAVIGQDVLQPQADADGLGVVAMVADEQGRGAGELVSKGPDVGPVGLVEDPEQGIAGRAVGGR